MHTLARFASILGLALWLSACGGSGGGSGTDLAGGETSCGQPDCGPETDSPTPPAPTPTGQPAPAVPLACGGAERAACPDGYRCVEEPNASCDAAAGEACAGICVLGTALPGCGGPLAAACPEGQVCADDPADDCEGGPAADCPGLCRPTARDEECTDDAGCPAIDAACAVCADGTRSCPQTRCLDGACTVDARPCDDARSCGGRTALPCPPGFACAPDPNAPCDAADRAECPGVCRPAAGGDCRADEDCPPVRVPCTVCADGSERCARTVCDQGRCGVAFPTCPPAPGCGGDADCAPGQACLLPPDDRCDPATGAVACAGICVAAPGEQPCGEAPGDACPEGYACIADRRDGCEPDAAGHGCPGLCVPVPPPPCRADDDCVIHDGGCVTCPDDSQACPEAACREGACVVSMPICPDPARCRDDADCAVAEVCSMCADGAVSCPRAECRDGRCAAVYPGCPDPESCGGFAGLPCPPGYTCVDRPGDACDPADGAADCAGICRREEEPRRCAGFAGETCPTGYECIDAADDCDPENGGADCPGFCRPAPLPPCAGDADCVAIGAPCRVCADGSAACPHARCDDGRCRTEFPACEPAPNPEVR